MSEKEEVATNKSVAVVGELTPENLKKIDEISNKYLHESISASSEMQKTMMIAAGLQQLEVIITDKVMAPIMTLMGTKLGFVTDRDKKEPKERYSMAQVKKVVIEGLLNGVYPYNNQLNIIAEGLYIAKNGYTYKISNLKEITDFKWEHELLDKVIGKNQIVAFKAKWKNNGVEDFLLRRRQPRPASRRPARRRSLVPRADTDAHARPARSATARARGMHRRQHCGGQADQPGGALRGRRHRYLEARPRRADAPARRDRSGAGDSVRRPRRHRGRAYRRRAGVSAPRLAARAESWPIRGTFTISRESRTEARVVVAEIADGDHVGRGECVPAARYGETVPQVMAQLDGARAAIAGGLDRDGLRRALPAGAARNALDCALWDLEAKRAGVPV